MKKMIMLLLTVAMASGCLQTYQRQLEPKYNAVYYEFFENNTLEPGLENLLADALSKETMKDRHLRVTRKRDADLIVRGKISSYKQDVIGLDQHRVATQTMIRLKANIELYEPGSFMPFRSFSNIEGTSTYTPDVRRDIIITKEEAKANSAHNLAQRILHHILYKQESQ